MSRVAAAIDGLSGWLGMARSLLLYRRPGRQGGLRRLYRPLVEPGDLVFDLGAHLGDRSIAFAALGARVVAVEPQPRFAACLERIAARSDRIVIEPVAVGRSPGTAHLAISRRTPTVSTLAPRWGWGPEGVDPAFAGIRWEDTIEVPVTTLDALIERHGSPAFCKIDVEGYEAEVLEGLSQALRGLSVEFVRGRIDIPIACMRRLDALGPYEFNAARGEDRRFLFERWQSSDRIGTWLGNGAGGAPSGDVYARLLRPSPGADWNESKS